MGEISVWLRGPSGDLRLPGMPVTSVTWGLEENKFGVLRVSGPLAELDTSLLQLDCRLEIMRSIDGGAPYIEGNAPFLLRYWDFGEDENGAETYELEAYTPEYLLTGRIIDSYASTEAATNALTTKTGTADDIAKELVTENIVSASTAARNVAGLTVDADLSAAASTTKSCSYDNLWRTLLALAEDSLNQGTYLSYAVLYNGDDLVFRTFSGQRGVAHTGAGAIIASKEIGNLRAPRIITDYRMALTAVRAGGKGVGADRATARVEDTDRSAASPYAYREAFLDAIRAETTAALTADARAELEANRPLKLFTGQFVDTDYARYGEAVNFGDTLEAHYGGEAFTCRLSKVDGAWSKLTGETLTINLTSTEAI